MTVQHWCTPNPRSLREQMEELELRALRQTQQIGIIHQHDIKNLETNLRPQKDLLLPLEILDPIADNVESYNDLLAMALSSKALYSMLVQTHLPFRNIATVLPNPPLWAWLSRPDDHHAARVRSLTIVPFHPRDIEGIDHHHDYVLRYRLPSNFQVWRTGVEATVSDYDSEIELITALQRMSRLRRFRWYRSYQPVVEGENDIWDIIGRLGTVKELDVLDIGDNNYFSEVQNVTPIIFWPSFLRLGGFTSFRMRSFTLNIPGSTRDVTLLVDMLLNNCPDLESLSLELFFLLYESMANIDRLLECARWPNLRVFRLHRGFKCNTFTLIDFFLAHPVLEDVALAPMMIGRRWAETDFPLGVLPNLRRLTCSSFWAAALLKQPSSRPLETLEGVDLHDMVIMDDYFSWDDNEEDEEDEDFNYNKQPSPWKALFLERLERHSSITRMSINCGRDNFDPKQIQVLAVIAPQLQYLDTFTDNGVPAQRPWFDLYRSFPSLQIIRTRDLLHLGEHTKLNLKRNDGVIQELARVCPSLRLAESWDDMAVIIRNQEWGGVRWIYRQRGQSEEPIAEDGEDVFGWGLPMNS